MAKWCGPSISATSWDLLHRHCGLLFRGRGPRTEDRGAILTDGPGYRLETGIDARRFQDLLIADGSGATRLAELEEALGLWHGNAVEEFAHEEWAEAEAARLCELHLIACEDRSELLVALGRADEAVAALEAHITRNPHRDRPRGLLMQALAVAGRQAEALRTYREYRTFLVKETGTEPSALVEAIEQRIVMGESDERQEVTIALERAGRWPSGPAMTTSKAPASAPLPIGAARQRTTNLPVNLPQLIGCDGHVSDVADLVRARSLVTLVGPGGVGKTSMALSVASRLAHRFADGVWMIELANVHGSAAVIDAVSGVLGINTHAGASLEENLVSVVSGRQMMIVLDNCEHVLDGAAALVHRLLDRSPGLTVLATSREPLGLASEQVSMVPSLGVSDGFASPAVELFVERAVAVAPGFRRHAENEAELIAEICEQLDGLPLAIELAAARMVSMTTQEVRDRLDNRFRLLAGSRRSVERHQTLLQTCAWSYDLLERPEKDLLSRCGVFLDGFTVDGAAHVAGSDGPLDEYEVMDTLDSLVRKSLVVFSRQDSCSRYELLETIRHFALDQLTAAGVLDSVRRQHAEYFATAAATLAGNDQEVFIRSSIDWLDIEFANLRAAFRWATDASELSTSASLAANSSALSIPRQRFESLSWAAEILDAATEADIPELSILHASLSAVCFLGLPHESIAHAKRARELSRTGSYASLNNDLADHWAACAHVHIGQLDRATELLRALQQSTGVARAAGIGILASVLAATGCSDEAMQTADLAVTEARKCGDLIGLTNALWTSGLAYVASQPDIAAAHWNEGLSLSREHRISIMSGIIARDTAAFVDHEDKCANSLLLFDEAVEAFHDGGNIIQMTITLGLIAEVLERGGHLVEAARFYGWAVSDPQSATLAPGLGALAEKLRAQLGDDRFDECTQVPAGLTIGDAGTFARQQLAELLHQLETEIEDRPPALIE
jgi:predicted ATPase